MSEPSREAPMSLAPAEERRKAAQMIEQAIERQLQLLRVPVPEHSWILDKEGEFSECAMTYGMGEAEKLTISFRADELDCFEKHPKFATLSKIASLASMLLKEHQRLAK